MQVREWIIEKCSPSILRRSRRVYHEESQSEIFEEIFEPKLKSQLSTQSEPKKLQPKKNVQKVSVEVDATPAARSASVLKQTPIELTKSLDRGLLGPSEADEERPPLRRSKTSVSLTLASPADGVQQVPRSSDSEIPFLTSSDVNVTSRDSQILLRPETLPEDTLKNIKKRNFPKVLPDFPDKRLSLPQGKGRLGPPPPPRVSTLDRNHPYSAESPGVFTLDRTIPHSAESQGVFTLDRTHPHSAEIPGVTGVFPTFRSSGGATPTAPTIPLVTEPPVSAEVRRVPKMLIVAHKNKPITRKDPIIVIPPTIGPTQGQKTSPHVNLQEPFSQNPSGKSSLKVQLQQPSSAHPKESTYVPDSKGPSDKVLYEKVVSSKPKKSDVKSVAKRGKPVDVQEPPKCLIRTNALDDTSVGSSSSSSIAKESTGTIKRGKKNTKSTGT